ncbi:MAG: phosphoribosylformylglycinamidine synthase subunit PurS [Candidatus Limnocylindrales bacterium]
MVSQRYAVHVMPKPGILDPQGKAVEQSLPHLHVEGVHEVRVGRRVELTVEAPSEGEARALVERLARELFANPLIETWALQPLGATSSVVSSGGGGAADHGPPASAPAPADRA